MRLDIVVAKTQFYDAGHSMMQQPGQAGHSNSRSGTLLHPAVTGVGMIVVTIVIALFFRAELDRVVAAMKGPDAQWQGLAGEVAAKIVFIATLPTAIGLLIKPAGGFWRPFANMLVTLGALLTSVAAGIAWFLFRSMGG